MTRSRILAIITLAIAVAAGIFASGCAKGPFFRPPGTSVASCSGVMRLETGSRVRLKVDLYKNRAELAVYSITSQRIRTLATDPMNAGTHTAVWDGRDDSGRAVSSGVYISRLTSGKHTATSRMMKVK
mgnify:FL=1